MKVTFHSIPRLEHLAVHEILLTCEHGGNQIPKKYADAFGSHKKILNSHRGWDIGALAIVKEVQRRLKVPLIFSEVSRLLIDLNRSPHHPKRFSKFTGSLPIRDRAEIEEQFYNPYRNAVFGKLSKTKIKRLKLHFSFHSFTPVLNGEVRTCDLGILYDPKRPGEKTTASRLKQSLKAAFPNYVIRSNYPYRGAADGLPSFLRKTITNYCGIEIEINQALLTNISPSDITILSRGLAGAIEQTLYSLK